MAERDVLAVLWEWGPETDHAGSRFWGCHSISGDGRIDSWPSIGLIPVGAARVTVTEGEGLDLLSGARAAHG